MASIFAGVVFALIALALVGVTFLDLIANAQARATGGDAGGVSFWPPLLALASGAFAIWLFLS